MHCCVEDGRAVSKLALLDAESSHQPWSDSALEILFMATKAFASHLVDLTTKRATEQPFSMTSVLEAVEKEERLDFLALRILLG